MWTIENWSWRMMISSRFFLFLSLSLYSQAPKSRVGQQHGKIATWESVEVFFFVLILSLSLPPQLELSFVFAFIHLPTDSNGRKSNDVRLIGIVVPISNVRRRKKTNQDTDQKTWGDLISILEESHAPKTNITKEDNYICIWSGNNRQCLPVICVWSWKKKAKFILQMDKVLLSIIKPKEKKRKTFFCQ